MGGREPQKPSRFPLLQQEVRCRLSKHMKSYSGFNGVSVSLFRWEPEQRSLLKQRKERFFVVVGCRCPTKEKDPENIQ